VAALDLIAQEKYDRMVAWGNREVIDVPISEAIAKYSAVDIHGTLIRTAIGLGTYVGEIVAKHEP
jgi:6-phosphofructokinase 1